MIYNMDFYRNNDINNFDLKSSINILNNPNSFQINRSNFDIYKRSFKKLQSLLAEIMSVITLLIDIGRQLSIIFGSKMISKEIIRSFININKEYKFNQTNENLNLALNNEEHKNIFSSERNKIKPDLNENEKI